MSKKLKLGLVQYHHEESVERRMNDFRNIPNWNIDEVRKRYNEELLAPGAREVL